MSLTRHMHVVQTEEEMKFMETALKIAFATSDMQTVNQHFGSAKSFAVYAVDPDHSKMLEAAQFGELSQDGNEAKLSIKIDLLEGCAAVYCQAIGASAINQIIARGIQPVKVHEGSKITDLIVDLQNEMKAGPSSWVAKAIHKPKNNNPDRFKQMEEDGWDE
ncbi:MAG: NifB/NifX family molybdenum-iron cluster-binding protein [Methylococcaceae bacterium]